MRGVVDHFQAVPVRNLLYALYVAGVTVDMDCHDRGRACGDRRFDLVRVDRQRLGSMSAKTGWQPSQTMVDVVAT